MNDVIIEISELNKSFGSLRVLRRVTPLGQADQASSADPASRR